MGLVIIRIFVVCVCFLTNTFNVQGPVSFREDGIRNLFILRVFQYRYEEGMRG